MNCTQCAEVIPHKKNSDTINRKTGRPWKHPFCGVDCYNRWKADQHLATKAKWLSFQRDVWGTTEIGRSDPSKARGVGRTAEIIARDLILPKEGFSDIYDLSGMSNQFFIDFVASYKGERVLVDATIKLKAYFPEKAALAAALRMRLFIIHISPKSKDVYFLHEVVPGRKVTRVPASYIRQLQKESSANE